MNTYVCNQLKVLHNTILLVPLSRVNTLFYTPLFDGPQSYYWRVHFITFTIRVKLKNYLFDVDSDCTDDVHTNRIVVFNCCEIG